MLGARGGTPPAAARPARRPRAGARRPAVARRHAAERPASRLGPDAAAAADEGLLALRSGIQGTVADVRRIVEGLRPPALDELGLAEAVAQLADRLDRGRRTRRSRCAPTSCRGWRRPSRSPPTGSRQEALTNVLRHAGRTVGTVRLECVPGGLLVEVRDDGAGRRRAAGRRAWAWSACASVPRRSAAGSRSTRGRARARRSARPADHRAGRGGAGGRRTAPASSSRDGLGPHDARPGRRRPPAVPRRPGRAAALGSRHRGRRAGGRRRDRVPARRRARARRRRHGPQHARAARARGDPAALAAGPGARCPRPDHGRRRRQRDGRAAGRRPRLRAQGGGAGGGAGRDPHRGGAAARSSAPVLPSGCSRGAGVATAPISPSARPRCSR